ncbi:MAG: ferritin-like domain-containing protein [Thermoproteota archaeon]|nr:ferritin-like domain-containing protein [Thermoproteota archaeon]
MTKQPHHQKQEEKDRDRIGRLLIYLNDALSMENASAERLQERTKETDIEELKIALQKHFQETRQQQERLERIITNLGGKPTEQKAGLPMLSSPKSIVEDMENKATTAEWQLKYAEQDAIIENAEAVGYQMLIQWAIKVNVENVIPVLMQNLQEEENMRMWLRANTPRLFAESWPRIEEEADAAMRREGKETKRR